MIDAIFGAVIMVVATTSLAYSIEVAVKAYNDAGRYELNLSERELLRNYGLDKDEMQPFYGINININKSRMKWGKELK